MHKTDLIWGGTWGGTANFWGGMCPPRPPLGDATEVNCSHTFLLAPRCILFFHPYIYVAVEMLASGWIVQSDDSLLKNYPQNRNCWDLGVTFFNFLPDAVSSAWWYTSLSLLSSSSRYSSGLSSGKGVEPEVEASLTSCCFSSLPRPVRNPAKSPFFRNSRHLIPYKKLSISIEM